MNNIECNITEKDINNTNNYQINIDSNNYQMVETILHNQNFSLIKAHK